MGAALAFAVDSPLSSLFHNFQLLPAQHRPHFPQQYPYHPGALAKQKKITSKGRKWHLLGQFRYILSNVHTFRKKYSTPEPGTPPFPLLPN